MNDFDGFKQSTLDEIDANNNGKPTKISIFYKISFVSPVSSGNGMPIQTVIAFRFSLLNNHYRASGVNETKTRK